LGSYFQKELVGVRIFIHEEHCHNLNPREEHHPFFSVQRTSFSWNIACWFSSHYRSVENVLLAEEVTSIGNLTARFGSSFVAEFGMLRNRGREREPMTYLAWQTYEPMT
jgi:hypothetical protein